MMTLENFLQSVASVAHGVFAGNLMPLIVWLALLYGAYRFARWVTEEKVEPAFLRFLLILSCIGVMELGVRENSTIHIFLGFALFLGVAQVVYTELMNQYRPYGQVTFADLKPTFTFLGVVAVGASLYMWLAPTKTVAQDNTASKAVEAAKIGASNVAVSAPKPTVTENSSKPVQEDVTGGEYHLEPNTTLVVERMGLSVRNSACSSSEPATYTDNQKVVLAQYDKLKTTDEPIVYCTKGNKSYPWVLVSFQVAGGITVNEGRGGQGWVSLCDTRLQDESVAKHPVCKK